MKTKAQELIHCEGGIHCLGCGTNIAPWFSLRCQICWQKQAETPRDTSFKAPTDSEDTRASGWCVICAAPTFGAAIFCRFCELTSFASHQGSDLLSAEQKEVAVLEGVCERCKMRETEKNSKTCFWCNSSLERRLTIWKCMSCPQPISKTGTQKTYQCNNCIFEQRTWTWRCKLCFDLRDPGKDTCEWCRDTNHSKKFFDKYMGVEPEIRERAYKDLYGNAGSSGAQGNS